MEIYIIHCPFIGESSLRGSTVVKLVWPNGCLISVNRYTFSPFLLTCMPASALKGCAIFTPHAQRERGKVIGRGVHIYIYICLWSKKKFESYFRDRLTFSNVDSRTSR